MAAFEADRHYHEPGDEAGEAGGQQQLLWPQQLLKEAAEEGEDAPMDCQISAQDHRLSR